MTEPVKPQDTQFDQLRRWRHLSVQELVDLWSEDVRSLMIYFIDRLGGTVESNIELNQTNFPKLVGALNANYERGSRALGEAIIDGTALIEAGDFLNAERIFCNFKNCCASICYREVAEQYLEKLRAARI